MADKPILFSAPMIHAILREIESPGTGKTQTRRLLKPQPPREMVTPRHYGETAPRPGLRHTFGWFVPEAGDLWPCNDENRIKIPYAIGNRLWVREAWRSSKDYDEYQPIGMMDCPIYYEADESTEMLGRLRPSIHMPRWASRLTLHVTDVRLQRLQDINEADARAEGSFLGRCLCAHMQARPKTPIEILFRQQWCHKHGDEFRYLWGSLNAKRAPWDSNPWVVAVTFRPVLGNIDEVAE